MRRKIIVCVLASLLLLSISAVPVLSQQTDEAQRITSVQLEENGDAVWTVEIREPLETQDEINGYEAYVQQVQNQSNTTQTDRYRNRFSDVVNSAGQEFDREMSLESFQLSAEVENTASGDVGVTEIQFTWVGFAQVQNDSILVGQVLSDGYILSEGERLTVSAPQGYELQQTPSGATQTSPNTVEWTGPYAFNDLQMQFSDEGSQQLPLSPSVIGAIILLVIVVIAVVVYIRKRGESESTQWSSDDLQTEGEKVLELLEENDGRMKQKNLKNLDWSEAKISRVTSNLEDQGVIEKLRIGRENVLSLEEESRKED